ncbi:hypothetical protein APX70_02884 [Pseudomonas syringae pv. maculicola]|uniref:Uncharacterized protein n=1 Tax=Pseudomonas syringae pv. maculicola TaxID=59511 RepID=A0A3M2UT44_PSEYM|nr:hypothetical protein APX70_02884 [Pseudomonas syringae pv. maculicola]
MSFIGRGRPEIDNASSATGNYQSFRVSKKGHLDGKDGCKPALLVRFGCTGLD